MSESDIHLRRMRDLFDGWRQRHNEAERKWALATLKGRTGALRSSRERTIEWAERMLPAVESARDEIGASMTLNELAEWLNTNGHRTSTSGRFVGKNLGTTLFSVDRLIAADAILECRTRMSALALSADFSVPPDDIVPLESECLNRIKAGIVLARNLERRSTLTDSQLADMAREMAINEARDQRVHGEYLPMLARDCYLTMAEFNEAVPSIERLNNDSAERLPLSPC